MINTTNGTFRGLALGFMFAIWIGTALNSDAAPDRVTVAWDPNPETNIAGYNVYYGVVGASVTNKVSPGTTTQQQVINLQPQTQYWFYVTAFNTVGLESDKSAVLTYTTPINQAPTVTLGGDRIIIVPDSANLAPVATDDYRTPPQLTASWSQLAGPTTVAISPAGTLNPGFQFNQAGTYIFRLTVNDGSLSAADEVTVYAYAKVTTPPPGAVVPTVQGIFNTVDGVVIQWASTGSNSYRIAYKRDLNDTTWTVLANNIAGQGPTSYWVDDSGQLAQQGYYAIFQMP